MIPREVRRARIVLLRRALAREHELAARDAWSRDRLEQHQRERLQELVRFAKARSPVYRERLEMVDPDRPVDLEAISPVTKRELMDSFSAWATDPRLKLDELDRHLRAVDADVLLHGEYRVVSTGGSSGRRGIFCFSQEEWVAYAALVLREMRAFGAVPADAPGAGRRRVASVLAPAPAHISWRFNESLDLGLRPRLTLSVTSPLQATVDALNAFAPDQLTVFPSFAAMLVDEQRAGRLRIAPRLVITGGEVRPPTLPDAVREVWGVDPHEVYGSTEGLSASTCEHRRLHLAEDEAIVEVEEDRLLYTNLWLRTQPLIRYEITDLVVLDPEPCPCGRTTRVIASVDGRADDVVRLPAADGTVVTLHPEVVAAPVAAIPGVRHFQIVHDAQGLRVLLVPVHDPAAVAAEARRAVMDALVRFGAPPTDVRVELVDRIPRADGPGAKHRSVRSEVAGIPTAR